MRIKKSCATEETSEGWGKLKYRSQSQAHFFSVDADLKSRKL